MPMIWIPEEELRALQAVLTTAEQVNWEAYERAKEYLIEPRFVEQEPLSQEPVIG